MVTKIARYTHLLTSVYVCVFYIFVSVLICMYVRMPVCICVYMCACMGKGSIDVCE